MKQFVFGLTISLLMAFNVFAEQVKNYSGCDVCTGAIYYEPKEARKILGEDGKRLFKQITQSKTIKIDLDKKLANGNEKSPDTGYELQISGENIIFIKFLPDHSLIQIVADLTGAKYKENEWNPEIYFESSDNNRIELTDSLETAWKKFKDSGIYFSIMGKESHEKFEKQLKDKIIQSIIMLLM